MSRAVNLGMTMNKRAFRLYISRIRTWNEGVLRASVYERYALHDTGYGVERGRRDLCLILIQGGQEILCCVVKTWDDVAVPLSVCCPQHDYLVDLVLLLELPGS
jgi:hypothetical protein